MCDKANNSTLLQTYNTVCRGLPSCLSTYTAPVLNNSDQPLPEPEPEPKVALPTSSTEDLKDKALLLLLFHRLCAFWRLEDRADGFVEYVFQAFLTEVSVLLPSREPSQVGSEAESRF